MALSIWLAEFWIWIAAAWLPTVGRVDRVDLVSLQENK
jgi:hypothetical protein